MLPGELLSSEVRGYTSRVVVQGVERTFASWEVDRELSGDLPTQISLMSGLVQATGTIVWVPDYPVDDFPTTPMNTSSGWMPRKGDPVQIYQGDGNNEWQVFEGVIDKSSGEVGAPGFRSQIIDHRDKLSKQFRHDPLLRIMPPLYRAEPDYRGVGLSYLYFVDAALRKAGFYVTPPAENRQAVSVPAQSSMWPETGVMTTGAINGLSPSAAPWAVRHNSVDGIAMSNVLARYSPATRQPYGQMMRVSLTVDPEHAGIAIITCRFGSNTAQLSINSARSARAFVNGTVVASLPMGDAIRVSMIIEGNQIELRTDQNEHVTATRSAPTTQALSEVQCQADANSRVAGFHVCYPNESTKWAYTDFVPSAQYRYDSMFLFGIMDAAPAITDGTCYDILDEISEATLSAMWIDETGVFQWAPSNVLSNAAPVRSLTTADDILSLSWTDDLLAVRSEVTVTQRTPAITTSRWDNIIWHQGGRQSLESGQMVTEFISPDGDTDWVQPAEYQVYGEPGTGVISNRGWGSFVGAVLSDDDTETGGSEYLSSTMERVNGDTYKLTHTAGNLPSGAALELRYLTNSVSIWPRWRGESLPIIRGYGKVEWADTEVLAEASGPDWAPPLTHDSGPWLSRSEYESNTEFVDRLANYLQAQTSREWPNIGDIEVLPDPRLQLGDRVTIRSEHYLGAVFSGVIVSLKRSQDPEAATMSIGLRLTTMETTFQTYEAWNEQYPGTLSYAQWVALTSAQTYHQFITSED